jgi:O-antigen/teichoic acid export membrane protein
MTSVFARMAAGATWMVLLKLVERLVGLASIAVLARLLIPADFGLVALATAIVAVLEVLGAFSFDIALIQKRDASREHFDTAWTFNVIVGTVACGILLLLAPGIAAFYDEPRLAPVVLALSAAPLIGSLENIGVVAYRRDMEFHRDFKFLLTKKLLAVGLTLVLAVVLRSYWALVAGILAGRLAGTVLSYMIHEYRPRLSLSRRKELMGFSAWLLATNVASFVSNRSGDFIIGKTVGTAGLGVYGIASEISNLPTTELVSPINRAVFPGYAMMSHDRRVLSDGYFRVLGLIAAITIPAALGIAYTADVFVPLVFGSKWMEAIPLIKVIAFYGIIQALQNNIASVHYALGKPRIVTIMGIVYSAILVPALIVFSTRWGVMGAAYALLVVVALIAPINIYKVLDRLDAPFTDFLREVWRPALAGAGMCLAVHFLRTALGSSIPLLWTLLLLMITGALTYALLLFGAWRVAGRPAGAERVLVERLLGVLQRLQKGAVASG